MINKATGCVLTLDLLILNIPLHEIFFPINRLQFFNNHAYKTPDPQSLHHGEISCPGSFTAMIHVCYCQDLSLSPVLGLFPPRGFFPDDARMDDPSPMWRRRDGLSLRLPPKSTKDEFKKPFHRTKVRKIISQNISLLHYPRNLQEHRKVLF